MVCPYCGVDNSDDALYCQHCGKVLPGKAWKADTAAGQKTRSRGDRILMIMMGVVSLALVTLIVILGVIIYQRSDRGLSYSECMKLAEEKYTEEDYLNSISYYQLAVDQRNDDEEALHGLYMCKLMYDAEQIAYAISKDDWEGAGDCLGHNDFHKVLKKAGQHGISYPLIVTTRNQQVGFYELSDGAFAAYCGDYDGEVREGDGWLVAADVKDYIRGKVDVYAAHCEWAGDAPNGVAIDFILDRSRDHVIRLEGTAVDGLWDGDLEYSWIDYTSELHGPVTITLKNGLEQPIEELEVNGEKVYRLSEYIDGENYIYELKENLSLTFGIYGYSFVI